jgi:DNA-binding beta-propeller fold protein YncE
MEMTDGRMGGRQMRANAIGIGFMAAALALAVSPSASEATETLWSLTSFGTDDFFHEPSDIEVDREKSLIYVVDAGSARVLVFDLEGKFVRAVGRKGQGPGEFTRPTGACVLPGGGLGVADPGANRIQVFDAAGRSVRSINVTEARVADLVWSDGRFYTVPSFGSSGYALAMGSEDRSQPLANVLDGEGRKVAEIAVGDFPETHPFVRAIKHRVGLALSPREKLFLPHFAMNLVQIFERTGQKVGDFARPLPFKPMAPALVGERSPEAGVVQMRAELDFVSLAAKFGPDGALYILTVTESLADIRKRDAKLEDPLPVRIDVVDPESRRVVRTLLCDPGVKAFDLIDGKRLVYVYQDAEAEIALKSVRY